MKLLSRIPTSAWLTLFVALALGQVWLVRDTVMGDSFIHFVFARGIALGDWFSYNGIFSAGSTSPLWSAMLAPVWAIWGDGVVYGSKILASLFVASSVILSYYVALRIAGHRVIALLTSFLFATSFVLPFWAAKGMETPFWVNLVLLSFLVYCRILDFGKNSRAEFSMFNVQCSSSHTIKYEVLLGTLLGIGVMTRPEAWFLGTFLGLGLLVRTKSARPLLTLGLPAAVVIAPYYTLLYLETGHILPSSAARVLHAQQWLEPIFGMLVSTEILRILATKFVMLTPFFGVFLWLYIRGTAPLPRGGGRSLTELTKKFQHALGMTSSIDRRYILWPIFAWLGFHVVFFSTVMPMTQGYRYLLAVMPFFIVLSLIGLWQFRGRGFFGAVVMLVVGSWLAISNQQLLERQAAIAQCEVPYINSVRYDTGHWLAEHTAPTDVIAIKEVDQSAYYSGRQVLSMDGTLFLPAVPYVQTGDQLGYLQQYRPDWLVVEEEMYNYPDWTKSNLHPLIDPALEAGETKTLGTTEFTLRHRLNVGTQNDCAHFVGDKPADEPYYWYFYELQYE